MGSREKDPSTPHQPLLSSLVVRATDSGGGAGGGSGGAGGSDYEPGEVRHDPPPYSRSSRFSDNNHGYRMRTGSASPVRRRMADHHYDHGFDHSSGPPPRSRGFGGGRDTGRYRDYSPPYGGRGRFGSRGFDGPGLGPGPYRGNGMPRNNPNVRPRDGDWICPEPTCNNLNFARRDHCNNCKRYRYAPGGGSGRRGYQGGGPPPPPRRFTGPPIDHPPPGRISNGYRSPPRGFARDGPRDFLSGGPPPYPRHEGGFADHPIRRDRSDYLEDDYRERSRFDRPIVPDWGHRERGRDSSSGYLSERKGGYERRPLSPSPPPPPSLPLRGHWDRDIRERSRSPIRGGLPPPLVKDYRHDLYLGRGRDERRGVGRG